MKTTRKVPFENHDVKALLFRPDIHARDPHACTS